MKYSASLLAGLLIGVAHAAPPYHPAGVNLSLGDLSTGTFAQSALGNPAAGAALRKHNGDQYNLGIAGSLGAGAEYGEVDNLFDTLDAQAEAFDEGFDVDNGMEIADTAAAVADLNATLAAIDENGYGKIFASASAGTPVQMLFGAFGGSLTLDISRSLAGKGMGLHEPIEFDAGACAPPAPCGDVTIDTVNDTFTVDNDSTLLILGADIFESGVGYSRALFAAGANRLYGGIRATYYRVGLGRFNYRLGDVEDAEDLLEDISEDDFEYSSAVGVDAGLLWVGSFYRIGASVINLNEPEFDYNTLDLGTYDTGSSVYERLSGGRTYVMETQVKLEAALISANQHWLLGATIDSNAIRDAFGDEYQWAGLSAAYATDSWLIPGLRAGYRQNLAGSELRYVTAGTTLFKVLNLDVAYGLDRVKIDGEDWPRSFAANLGIDIRF